MCHYLMNALGLMDTMGLTLAIFMTNLLVVTCTAAEGQFPAASVKVDIISENSQWLHGYGPRKSEGEHDRGFTASLLCMPALQSFF